MASERKIRRYIAYFQGWATAFGVHDKHLDERRDLMWLFGEGRIGLIQASHVKSFADILLPTNRDAVIPRVELGSGELRIEETRLDFGEEDKRTVDAVLGLLHGTDELHLHHTYHIVYPTGTRILTLSRQSPLGLIYREIEPLTLRVD